MPAIFADAEAAQDSAALRGEDGRAVGDGFVDLKIHILSGDHQASCSPRNELRVPKTRIYSPKGSKHFLSWESIAPRSQPKSECQQPQSSIDEHHNRVEPLREMLTTESKGT